MQELELDDIQGFLRHGYPYFDTAAYCLFRIEDVAGAKRWLARLVDPGDSEPRIDHAHLKAQRLKYDDCRVVIALTACGLAKLGLDDDALRTFVSEFQEGMTAPHRTRLLGDDDGNGPEHWDWGGREPVDGLLIVFAEPSHRDEFVNKGKPPRTVDDRLAELETFLRRFSV